MRKVLLLVGFAGCMAATATAAPIYAPVPGDLFITLGAFDWAWAGPCSPVDPSCAVADMSYQSTQGWRIPDPSDFAGGPIASDFLRSDGSLRCASAYFNTVYDHCDYSDGVIFAIFNHPDNPLPGNTNVEFWAVRDASAVPEPATVLLLGTGTSAMLVRRRRRA